MDLLKFFRWEGDVCPHCGEEIEFLCDDGFTENFTPFTGECFDCPEGNGVVYTQICDNYQNIVSVTKY